jgi:tellurite methyltransferase
MGSTAYRYWEGVWRDPRGWRGWEVPSDWVTTVAGSWRYAGVETVLDLGCGIGRHTVALHGLGFTVKAIDKSDSACERAREVCSSANAEVEITSGDIRELPYDDAAFDAILAFNVVYHGTEDDLLACIAEVRRTLRPFGRYASTMLSKRNTEYGKGVEIAPNTFVQADAADDKVHPHLYCDATDLVRLHPGLKLRSCREVNQTADGSFHWYCEFVRSGSQ